MKPIKTFFWILCLSTAAASAAWAAPVSENRVGRTDIGVYGAALLFDEEADDSGWAGMNLSYGVTPNVALGVSGGWGETSVADDADLGVAEFMAEVIIRFADHPFHRNLVPYGVAGIGGIFSYSDRGNDDDRDDGTFGYKIGAGIDWILNPNWALNAEIAYHNANDQLPYGGNSDQEVTLDYWTAGGGLKYIF